MEKASAFCEYFSSVFTKANVSPEQRLNLKADTTELIADTTERDIEFYEEKNIENVRET